MLLKYSCAFVILPGGMGTLDEVTEAITLIQSGKLYNFPVILVGGSYWSGFYEWVQNTLVKQGAVSAEDLHFLYRVETPEEVVRIIERASLGIGLKLQPLAENAE